MTTMYDYASDTCYRSNGLDDQRLLLRSMQSPSKVKAKTAVAAVAVAAGVTCNNNGTIYVRNHDPLMNKWCPIIGHDQAKISVLRKLLIDPGRLDMTPYTDDDSQWHTFDVYLDLKERGLGLSIRGGADSPDSFGNTQIYVSQILGGGAAHIDGRLQIGDVLLSVNDISLSNIEHRNAVDVILRASPNIRFVVKRSKPRSPQNFSADRLGEQVPEIDEDEPLLCGDDVDDQERFSMTHQHSDYYHNGNRNNDNEYIKVELIRDKNGFGFSLAGGVDHPTEDGDTRIIVHRLVQNGPAHRNGLIQVNDQIVAVNDINLERAPQNWALGLIRSCPAHSVFTIRKALTWD